MLFIFCKFKLEKEKPRSCRFWHLCLYFSFKVCTMRYYHCDFVGACFISPTYPHTSFVFVCSLRSTMDIA
ncbi:NADH dehydrogenase subunit 5 [Iris pallida]|uniref:NADH dehydrogenase subunit 5 (Chloroplast) n=1 Tax=Iris pallida TaxID=29817 RepID=A0AAX6FFG3_IRIPA|nr:NADH dehydrogenase subunit 5 [Iris pallida]